MQAIDSVNAGKTHDGVRIDTRCAVLLAAIGDRIFVAEGDGVLDNRIRQHGQIEDISLRTFARRIADMRVGAFPAERLAEESITLSLPDGVVQGDDPSVHLIDDGQVQLIGDTVHHVAVFERITIVEGFVQSVHRWNGIIVAHEGVGRLPADRVVHLLHGFDHQQRKPDDTVAAGSGLQRVVVFACLAVPVTVPTGGRAFVYGDCVIAHRRVVDQHMQRDNTALPVPTHPNRGVYTFLRVLSVFPP